MLGVIQPLLRYPSNYFLTLISSTGDILYYLLAGGTESGSKPILYLMALSGEVPGLSRTSLNSLHISFQCKGSVPVTLILSTPPNISNTPLVSSNEWGCNKSSHAGQPHCTSASFCFMLNRVRLATLFTSRANTVCYLAPTVNSRKQATQYLKGLVDFNQSIPKIISFFKIFHNVIGKLLSNSIVFYIIEHCRNSTHEICSNFTDSN